MESGLLPGTGAHGSLIISAETVCVVWSCLQREASAGWAGSCISGSNYSPELALFLWPSNLIGKWMFAVNDWIHPKENALVGVDLKGWSKVTLRSQHNWKYCCRKGAGVLRHLWQRNILYFPVLWWGRTEGSRSSSHMYVAVTYLYSSLGGIKYKNRTDICIFLFRRNKDWMVSSCLPLFIPRILPDKVKAFLF